MNMKITENIGNTDDGKGMRKAGKKKSNKNKTTKICILRSAIMIRINVCVCVCVFLCMYICMCK